MRIDRLFLPRFGHFTDVDLTFPAPGGLHVVLGANEAGKSTALAALGNCLFGFPHRVDHDHLHPASDLRVGVCLRAEDGRTGTFFRTRRKDSLRDADGQTLPESAIAAFLGGATRDRFERVFGLNAAELRRGGESILEGKGDAGEAIAQAHTGLRGFHEAVERLGKTALSLAGDNRAGRALTEARKRYNDARTAFEDRVVRPEAFRDIEAERDRLAAARDANAQEADARHVERTRLNRIRATAAPLAAFFRAHAEQDELGPVSALPVDAAQTRHAALAARTHAMAALRRAREREPDLAAALDEPAPERALLAEATSIEKLAGQVSQMVSTRADREEQRGEAERAARRIAETARRLGLPGDAASVLARTPDTVAREAASRAIEEFSARKTAVAGAETERGTAAAALADAEATLIALPALAPAAPLADAIARVREEGRIDADCAALARASDEAARALADAMAALPLWTGDADALAAVPAPLDPDMVTCAQALQTVAAALRDAVAERARHDAALRMIDAELLGIETLGAVTGAAAIEAARVRRDAAWNAIRTRLAAGAPVADADLAAFESLTAEADRLADLRAADAERVARHDQARARRAETDMLRSTALDAESAATTAHEAARGDWFALWRPSGVEPGDPDAMRAWLTHRTRALDLRRRARDARARHEAADARRATCRESLRALLPEPPAGEQVAPLLQAATRLLAAREADAKTRETAVAALGVARKQMAARVRACDRAAEELAAWRTGWATHAATLGLSEAASAEDGRTALDLWREIDIDDRARREAGSRVERMTGLLDEFSRQVSDIVARTAPDLADAEATAAARTLGERLGIARAATARRTALREEIDTNQSAADAADDALRSLREIAGAADDAALEQAIERAERHAALAVTIAERQTELDRLGDGKTPDELAKEGADADLDAIPGRIAAIDDRLREIGEENTGYEIRRREAEQQLAAMDKGRAAAAAAQDMRDALAEMEDVAARYVRVRMAHTLLNAAIERFRDAQQAPLLADAGRLFAELTVGRYARLAMDADDARPRILAIQPDGTRCPHDKLSEGTRDQLYLALRLAAIGRDAEHAETLPFIADDLLVNFDDARARAGLRVLADFAARTQTILFTHHGRIADFAGDMGAAVHHLPAGGVPVLAG